MKSDLLIFIVMMKSLRNFLQALRSHQHVYSDEDYAPIYKAVYFRTTCIVSVFVALGRVLGEFVSLRIRQLAQERIGPGMPFYNVDLFLCILIEIHVKHKGQSGAECLVDCLLKCGDPIIYEYERMNALLLEEPKGISLTASEKTALADIMAYSVKHISTGCEPKEHLSQIQMSLSENRQQQAKIYKVEISLFYVKRYQNILRKFQSVAAIAESLLPIPQHFDAHLYSQNGNEVILVDLLEKIRKLVEVHSDDKVLEESAATYKALSDEATGEATYAQCACLLEAFIADLNRKCIEAFIINSDELVSDQSDNLLSALKRIAAFSRHFYTYNQELFDLMLRCVYKYESEPEEYVKYSYLSCLKMLPWALRKICQTPNIDKEVIFDVRSRLRDFVSVGERLLNYGNDCLKREAFKGLCLILTCFCPALASNKDLQHTILLIYKPTKQLITDLLNFIKNHVFVNELKGRYKRFS